jgi:DNA-3-methyladenine glycosylase II
VADIAQHAGELPVLGEFSLRAAAAFGFGPTDASPGNVLRLAFAVDGGRGYAGAVLRQPDELSGPVSVRLTLRGGAPLEAAVAQVARVLSLDRDGTGFLRVGERDHVLGALQRAHPGQRPVLFYSPYEAAAWSIISARRPAAQGRRVRDELALQFGDSFELEGETLHAFPQPAHLVDLGDRFPGLNFEKLTRLRSVAEAALEGELDVAALHRMGPERAIEHVQKLNGIGPFYAGLIVVRASGFADALMQTAEPKLLANAARLYGRTDEPTIAWLTALAERWRPFRTWATVLIRLAGDRGTTLDTVKL